MSFSYTWTTCDCWARCLAWHLAVTEPTFSFGRMAPRRLHRSALKQVKSGSCFLTVSDFRAFHGSEFTCSTGGVVTFTPRAVAQHPDKVMQLIKAIDQHPLWVSYVIPEVVALVKDITMEDYYEKSKLTECVQTLIS